MATTALLATGTTVSPRTWARRLSAPPIFSTANEQSSDLHIRRWRNVDPDIAQPALDHHYLTIHLGGAKCLSRRGEGKSETRDVASGALSIIPAGSRFDWSTRGPIDFAHIYLPPRVLNRVGLEEFGRDGYGTTLQDRLGIRDPLLQALFLTLLASADDNAFTKGLYLETLLHSLMLRLVHAYAGAPAAPLRLRHALAPTRLRRVLEFIEVNLAHDLALADLAGVAASSPFHFSRAFACETGVAPYAYVLRRRIEHAKALLGAGHTPLRSVATQCGFNSPSQFSRAFRRTTGLSPTKFRQQQ